MKPKLVLINGIPGTGKSTLAAKLKDDLGLSLMGKDMLKEFFFDILGVQDREESRMLGKATSEMLYILAEDYLATGRSLMLESAFFAEFARPRFKEIIARHPADMLEIYCRTEASERRRRFRQRFDSGNRHRGHQDGTDMSLLTDADPEPLDTYPPLDISKVIQVDTTHFGDTEYAELVKEIKINITQLDKRGGKEHGDSN